MKSRWLLLVCLLAIALPSAQQPSIDDFFRELSDGWVRLNPNIAVSSRYFSAASAPEQDRLEQQISSYGEAAERERLEYIRGGLADLGRFDRSRMTDAQKLSADLLSYHLQAYIDGAKYDDYVFPLDQFGGANIWLPNTLTVSHLLGQMDKELWRARRLVVDTGLHAKRWTREQAVDYGIEASEVERYVVMPGQACSYMIGQLKERFSERAFHNVVLAVGAVPLEILESEVNRYIRTAL